MESIKLNNGTRIPPVGFGLWLNTDREQCIASIEIALGVGYRHFDTAQAYGNEAFLGYKQLKNPPK